MTALAGKKALVTGGGSGIGKALSLSLAAAGAEMTVCGRRASKLDEVTEQIIDAGGSAVACPLDVSDAQQISETFAKLPIQDIVVCNAGVAGAAQPFVFLDLEAWNRTLEINLTGVMLTAQAAARAMIQRGAGGKIITVASIGAWKTLSNNADYGASKAAVLQLTKSIALELARHDIQVNALCPGFFRTDLAPDLIASAEERASRIIPARRIGEATELGDIVVWLASDASGYVTGSHFTVDGGFSLT